MKKKLVKLLAMLAAATCLVASAVSVSAAPYIEDGTLTEEQAQNYSSVAFYGYDMTILFSSFLSESMDAESLANITSTQDYFLEKCADQVLECKDDLGNFVEVTGIEGEMDDYELTLNYTVKCEKMDADIICTFKVEETGNAITGVSVSLTPLDITLNPDYPMSVNMGNAARNTVIGLVVVFVILAFLSFVIGLLKYVNPDSRKKKAAAAPVVEKKAAPAPAPAPAPVEEEVPADSDDEEIIAVIAAAIAMAQSEGGSEDNSTYRVSSIRRVSNGKRWKRA